LRSPCYHKGQGHLISKTLCSTLYHASGKYVTSFIRQIIQNRQCVLNATNKDQTVWWNTRNKHIKWWKSRANFTTRTSLGLHKSILYLRRYHQKSSFPAFCQFWVRLLHSSCLIWYTDIGKEEDTLFLRSYIGLLNFVVFRRTDLETGSWY